MSTYMYLQCTNHEPPILADDESGQHLYDLPRIREEIANRAGLIAGVSAGLVADDYFTRNSLRFLRQHPTCSIRIISEYGDDHTEEVPADD